MRSRTVANRAVLALAGLTLVAAAAVAAGRGEKQVVDAGLGHLRQAWAGPLILAGCLALTASLALLIAQIPRRAPRRLSLPEPGCQLDSRAVRHAVQAACSAVPGIVRARCRLTGRGHTMDLAIVLTVENSAHPGHILAAVSDGVIPQIAPLLAPRRLQTRIRLTVQRPRPHRVL